MGDSAPFAHEPRARPQGDRRRGCNRAAAQQIGAGLLQLPCGGRGEAAIRPLLKLVSNSSDQECRGRAASAAASDEAAATPRAARRWSTPRAARAPVRHRSPLCSCQRTRSEALTGDSVGQPLSGENQLRGADAFRPAEGNTANGRRQSYNLLAVFRRPMPRARDQSKQNPRCALLRRGLLGGVVFTAATKERFCPVRFELFVGTFFVAVENPASAGRVRATSAQERESRVRAAAAENARELDGVVHGYLAELSVRRPPVYAPRQKTAAS